MEPKRTFNKVIITSGPTYEPIDPIRYIANRSSGKTGFHLANEAGRRGIKEIVFISGPSRFIPEGVTLCAVETALQMRQHLKAHAVQADVIIMSAAVSDYRVAQVSETKIKKEGEKIFLELIKNPDLLMELGQNKPPRQVLVGFAAETDHILENAGIKFKKKNLDLLVLNQISPTNPAFDVDDNQVHLITADGIKTLASMGKDKIAIHIWDEIERISQNKRNHS